MLAVARASLSDVGTATDIAYCETELARAALLLGDPSTALDHAALAQAQLSTEARLEGAYVYIVRGDALLALERRDEADRRVPPSVEPARLRTTWPGWQPGLA